MTAPMLAGDRKYVKLTKSTKIGTAAAMLTFALVLAGCSAGPGAPLLRKSAADGSGMLIPGCKNVSVADQTKEFEKKFYMTTWGSAWLEGAQEGFVSALEKQGLIFSGLPKTGERYTSLVRQPVSFCRAYPVGIPEVVRILEELLLLQGYRLTQTDSSDILVTDYVERSHLMAQWRDRFVIGLESREDEWTIVRLLRIVFISRIKGSFNQGVSVGKNEAWLLDQLAERITMVTGAARDLEQ